MSKSQRLFYFVPMTTDALNKKYKMKLYVGPATNKVFGVCHALKTAGVLPVIVSGAIPWTRKQKLACVEYLRVNKICYAKIFSIGARGIKRSVASLSLLYFSIKYITRRDRVLIYNWFPEYTFAVMYLFAIGNRAIIDIEDAPTRHDRSLRGRISWVSFFILKVMCSKKCVTASRHISDRLGYLSAVPVYGVASYFKNSIGAKTANGRLRILYGGAIMVGTGLDLFMAAIRHIAITEPSLPIDICISGRFSRETFEMFKNEIERMSDLRIMIFGDIPPEKYWEMLNAVDVGLCLKLPSHALGQTTFPSKVIEYAAFGVLVCTTQISDISLIFDRESALLLDSEDPIELASLLIGAANDRGTVRRLALNGQRIVNHKYSAAAVGAELAQHLFG